METKTCCTCKIDKKIDEFSYKNKENEVYQCSCKEWWKETRKRNYEKKLVSNCLYAPDFAFKCTKEKLYNQTLQLDNH